MSQERRFKRVEELTFCDGFMFETLMKDEAICKPLVEILLDIEVDHIEYVEIEKTLQTYYQQKGVRFDCYLKADNKVIDIEIQAYKEKNLGKRLRYYQSMIDSNALSKGDDYYNLKESYIVFICTDDPLGKSLPVYTFKRTCQEDSTCTIDDKAIDIIYNINAWDKITNPQKKALLRYLSDTKATDSFTKDIESAVEKCKNNEIFKEAYQRMTIAEQTIFHEALEEGINIGTERGREEGISIGTERGISLATQNNALKLYSRGMTVEQIEDLLELSEDEVKSLKESIENIN